MVKTINKKTSVRKSKSKKSRSSKTKTKKTSKSTPTSTTVQPTPATATVQPTPTPTTAQSTPVTATAQSTPVTATAQSTPATTQQTSTENVIVNNSEGMYLQLIEHSKEMSHLHKKLTSSLKRVQKAYLRECRELTKQKSSKNRKKSKDPNRPKRAPSGFAKPTQITNTLCDFLEVPHGKMVARTDVTKKVTQYIKNNNLQVPSNKRQFIPDNKLQSILGPLDTVKIGKDGLTDAQKGYTYFNLQKYISSQFPKSF